MNCSWKHEVEYEIQPNKTFSLTMTEIRLRQYAKTFIFTVSLLLTSVSFAWEIPTLQSAYMTINKWVCVEIESSFAPRGASTALKAASRYPKQVKQALRMTPKQLDKSIGKFGKRIEQHRSFLKNPQSHVPNWNRLSPQHQQNLIRHWQNDISRLESYRDIAQAALRGKL